ncbi:sugar nucleotide-binding protein [Stenotrophomonas rhizophila]|uniref:sugar nucleotide-binding protein n=1 Tax=Stenotrophomonas rhizophila TaxID=216778 RepID=UPI0009DE5C00|nr:sugar nucleotide-binding protein [Stenotrophomonas rhizophila]
MMRIAVTGATGFIGTRLIQHLQPCNKVLPLSRSPAGNFPSLDLSQPTTLRSALESIDVDMVVHAAGMARRAQCTLNPQLAKLINVDATRAIAEWSAARSIRMIFLSSVGIDEDNVYADTKRQAEQAIEEVGVNASVLRLAYTFGMSTSESRPKPQMRLENEMRDRGSEVFDRAWKFQPTSLTHMCKVVGSLVDENISIPRIANIVTTEATTMHALASVCSGRDVRSSTDYHERGSKFIDTSHLVLARLPTCSLSELHDELRCLRYAAPQPSNTMETRQD